jgi:tetratricopeptide (TPR) repeat protein
MSKITRTALLSLLAALPCVAAQRALIIGNDNYPGQELTNCRRDAAGFATALNGMGWQTTLLLDATNQQFRDTLSSFVEQLSTNDVGLVYYSGHGMQVSGINYMLPVDFRLTDESTINTQAISLNDALARMQSRHVKVSVFILDACRNNPFQFRAAARAIQQSGWAAISGPSGTFLAFGTAPGSTASDNPGGNHGLFTQAILDNLPKNASLDLDSFFRLVRQEVLVSSSALQVPWTASSLTGVVSFGGAGLSTESVPAISGSNQALSGVGAQPGGKSIHDGFMQDDIRGAFDADDEGFERGLLVRGITLLRANREDEAIKSISSVLANHPHAAMVLRILSLIFQFVGRSVDGVKEADLSISSDPGAALGYAYRGFGEVETDPLGAIRDEQAALGIDPKIPGAHQTLALALLALGKTDSALTEAQKAIELDQSSALGYATLGKVLQAQGDYSGAERAFRHAVEKSSTTNRGEMAH